MDRLEQQTALDYSQINSDLADDPLYDFMEFRLIYEGPLKAASRSNTRVQEKHQIRKQLHPQLAHLWETHPALAFYNNNQNWRNFDERDSYALRQKVYANLGIGTTYKDFLSANFDRCGNRFIPLVHNLLNLVCSLDIVFLRRENPGDIVSGGDIDNRIKTLFDGLKMPKECSEITEPFQENETPFHCLLEDDSLITRLNVTTDRLLTPSKPDDGKNDVLLIINVSMKSTITTPINLNLI